MSNKKNNAGRVCVAGTVKGYQTFADNSTGNLEETKKFLRELRERRDNAAHRLAPLACGCRDPLRCHCKKGRTK